MDELQKGLEGVLSDPEAMSRITRMARQLMGNAQGQESGPPAAGSAVPADLSGLLKAAGPGRSPLAEALGPYLGERRRAKLARAMGMAAAARLAGGALKGAGGHGL